MPDYGKLIDEEKQRQDSALAAADAHRAREIQMVGFFREVEIELGVEMAKANAELKKRAAPVIFGPFRPVPTRKRSSLPSDCSIPAAASRYKIPVPGSKPLPCARNCSMNLDKRWRARGS